VLVALAPIPDWPAASDVAIVPWTRNERAPSAGLKTISYADNVVALRHAHEHGAAEAIFANTRGEVCEGTGSNVFYEYDGDLVTPPLVTGCLAGVTRELLIEWLQDEGRPVREVALALDTLREAGEAFLTSSTRDVMPIARVDGAALPLVPGPLTSAAAELFRRRAAENPDP
jgi:branched-chain amino acid aminotransferase